MEKDMANKTYSVNGHNKNMQKLHFAPDKFSASINQLFGTCRQHTLKLLPHDQLNCE